MARYIDAIIRMRDRFSPELRRINREIQEHSRQQQRLGREITQTGNSISGFSKKMAMLSAPLIGAAMAGLKLGSDLTNGMAKVSTLVDTNIVDMAKMREGIVDLSDKSGVAVTNLAEAQYQCISAGVEAGKSIQFLEVATKTARAGFTDASTAINGLTTVINAYGLEAEEAMKISDQMMIAQNAGKTTINEMAASMGNVIPIAAALNVDTKELFASIATLTKNGIGTSEAITGLKAAFANIIKPTAEATKAAAALSAQYEGFDFSAKALQQKGLQGFLLDVKAALQQSAPAYTNMVDQMAAMQEQMNGLPKGSDQYKMLKKQIKDMSTEMDIMAKASNSDIAGFATMFGSVEALNSMLVLTGKGAKDFDDILKQMSNSAGTTETAYQKMQTPAQEAVKAMNELKNAGMELAAGLSPLLKSTSLATKEFAAILRNLTPAQKEMLTNFGKFIIITTIVSGVLGKTISIVGKGVTSFGKFTGAVREASGVVNLLKAKFSWVISAFNLLKRANSGLANGFIKLLGLITKGFLMAGKVVEIVFRGMISIGRFLSSALTSAFQLIVTVAKFMGKSMLTVFRIIGMAVRGLFMNPIGLAIMAVVAVGFLLIRNWDTISDSMTATFTQIVNGAKQLFGGLIQFVTGVFTGDWAMAWQGVQNIFAGAFNALAGIAKAPLNAVIALINAAIGEINNISFTAPDWVPTFGGKTFQPNLPQIPMLYRGTDNWGGGMAMVHDKGAEIIDLPQGSRVYPHDKSLSMAKEDGRRNAYSNLNTNATNGNQNAQPIINLNVAKLADVIHTKEEADVYKLLQALMMALQKAKINLA